MAEALVKFFLQRVDLLLSQEEEILSGQKDQILLLASLLNEILRLQDENSRESAGDFPNCHEHKLRDIAYRFDDCLDEFIIQRYNTGGAHQSSLTSEFESKLQKIETQLDGILEEEEKRIAYCVEGEKSSSSNPSCRSLLFYIRYCVLYCCRLREYALVPNEEVDNEEEKRSFSCFMSNYINLPYYLRYCLLYCCIFPEKYWLRKGKLIRLLVAEGLIEEREGKTEEEIAEEYIEKLVNVGMLRVRDDCQSRGNRLKVADQYRQICLQMIEEEHFANRCSDSPMPLDVRRVVISEKAETILLNLTNLPVRSLLMVGINSLSDSSPNCLRSFVCGVKLLRVLDLEGVKIRTLPDEVGDLIHLRYLCLKNSDLTELPESLSNLKNLQTVDIRWCGMLASLPNGTSNLLRLRHLKMYKNVQVQGVGGVVVPQEIGLLQDLQTITGINAGVINQEFSKFAKLKRLGIKDVALDHSRELYSCIKNIPGLRSLSLEANSPYPEKPRLHLDEFSPPPLLQKLCLEGSFDKLPENFLSMKNVIKMRLGFSHLTENPASVLQFLPNLKELSLWQAYDAKHIGREFCDPGGFPKLEDLTIASHVLEEWSELVEGTMPSLKRLKFHNCLRLNLLPDGLQLLTTLQELVLMPLLDEHKLRLRPNGGSENYKIKHIPKVSFMTTSMVQLHVNTRQNS